MAMEEALPADQPPGGEDNAIVGVRILVGTGTLEDTGERHVLLKVAGRVVGVNPIQAMEVAVALMACAEKALAENERRANAN